MTDTADDLMRARSQRPDTGGVRGPDVSSRRSRGATRVALVVGAIVAVIGLAAAANALGVVPGPLDGGGDSPAPAFSTPNPFVTDDAGPSAAALTVDVSKVGRPFNRTMKGLALGNWTFAKNWNKPYIGEITGLDQVVRALDPGIIRYAGGLWANSVGFDRTKEQITPYTEWTKGASSYAFSYGPAELASLDAFAKSVDAEVMIQVNVSRNDPAMWADLVAFAKERGFTSLRYYEFGNELDLETSNGSELALDPQEYARRVVAYQAAMLAADATVEFVGGVAATASDIIRNKYDSGGGDVSAYITEALAASRAAGHDLDGISYHWYQLDKGARDAVDVVRWDYAIKPSSKNFWRTSYARAWSGLVAPWVEENALRDHPDTLHVVSELGVNSAVDKVANTNHMGALWYSDVLGRLASTGVDWALQWNGYGSLEEDFVMIAPDSDQTATPGLQVRPAYAAYVMYSKYFGDQLVAASSPDEARLSIWASTDSRDAGALKLRITNLTDEAITVPVALGSFVAIDGKAYELTSKNPTDMGADSNGSSASTTINGIAVDGNDVEGSLAKVQPKVVKVDGSSFTHTFPAYSSVAIVLRTA